MASDGPYGNYVLITDRINGVSGTPFRIRAYNTPVFPQDNEDIFAWYFKDSWRLHDKLTFNLGVRWEYQHSYLPEQEFDGARDFPTVFPAKHVDFLDVQTFNRIVPRLGVAYDMGGKSVIKATWGLYNYILGDTYGDVFAATATANAVFLWHDLNNDKLWTPNETNLALNNNPDFVSITAASNYELSPELKQPNTWESTVSFERELAPSLGFRVMYINRIVDSSLETINAKRPYEAYNIPITRRDPGPDGVLNNSDDGGSVTLYDYAASYTGANFVSNKRVNAIQHRSVRHGGVHGNQACHGQMDGPDLVLRGQESSLAERRLPESERRVLPGRRNVGLGRQYQRDLPAALQRLGFRLPAEPGRNQGAAHEYFPDGGS